MECFCCLDLGGVTDSFSFSVTVCCFQVVCQQCANDLTANQVCFCGQRYQGSQPFAAAAEPDGSHAQHPLLQQRLDQERAKMEDWFKQASGDHVVWHLDVPLLDYYQAELKAIALTQERLERVKAFPSGYFVATLPDYCFKPPGHIMYHHEYTGARPDHYVMPETASVQPHSFEEIFQFCLDSLVRALGPDEIKYGRGKHEFHQTALVRMLCEYENFNLTESLVDKYPQLNWQYQFLVEHPNFTLDFLKSRHEQGLARVRGTPQEIEYRRFDFKHYELVFTTGKTEHRRYSKMTIILPKLAKMPPLDARDYYGGLFCLLNNANFKWVLDYDYYGPWFQGRLVGSN